MDAKFRRTLEFKGEICTRFDCFIVHLKNYVNYSASLNLFERHDAHIQAYAAVSEQQNCFNSMLKLATVETSKLDRWIAFDPLYTLSPTSFLSLYK